MDPDLRRPSGNTARPERQPDASRSVLCIYCRTDKFVYWPPVSRPPSPDCPGCQRRIDQTRRDFDPVLTSDVKVRGHAQAARTGLRGLSW
jgi:hypothetical protein